MTPTNPNHQFYIYLMKYPSYIFIIIYKIELWYDIYRIYEEIKWLWDN